ncbi:MAG: NAD(P)H-hydrate dehydratase [Oscillospiraceae bacterium]
MKLLTAAQMKELDRKAIEEMGISSVQLMETAAEQVCRAAAAFLRPGAGKTAAVFCGPGNNGGDGVAAARLLAQKGVLIRAFLVGDRNKMTPDTKEMARRLEAAGGALEPFLPQDEEQKAFCKEADVIIDAIFGIGLRAAPRGDAAAAIDRINESGAPVVSADVPSGVLADTGQVPGKAVSARCTVAFTLAKPGLYTGEGSLCCGDLRIADIGIPAQLVADAPCGTFALTEEEARACLPRRKKDGHKGDFGKVGILAGSVGYTGAPTLAAKAAMRSGAGLVFLYVPESIYQIEAVKNTEAMVFPLPVEEGGLAKGAAEQVMPQLAACDACLIGPGLGRSDGARRAVRRAVKDLSAPLVVDADGLNLLAEHIHELDGRAAPVVLTPHEGEFRRLGGCLDGGDRIGAARAFARSHGCVLVLKGRGTVTALPDGTVYLNSTGNSGMAKGGSGDVLSGVLLALLGQGMEPGMAAAAAVFLHGAAGDLCALQWGEAGMLPSDLIEMLPKAALTKESK